MYTEKTQFNPARARATAQRIREGKPPAEPIVQLILTDPPKAIDGARP